MRLERGLGVCCRRGGVLLESKGGGLKGEGGWMASG